MVSVSHPNARFTYSSLSRQRHAVVLRNGLAGLIEDVGRGVSEAYGADGLTNVFVQVSQLPGIDGQQVMAFLQEKQCLKLSAAVIASPLNLGRAHRLDSNAGPDACQVG